MVKRIKLTIEYDGTNYFGWQAQQGGNTVAQQICHAIFCATQQEANLIGSGRTDSGVHAYGQVAHFDLCKQFDVQKLAPALNFYLPKDICILQAEEINSDFHARYSAKRKTYLYKLHVSPNYSPLNRHSHYQIPSLDIDRLRQGAQLLCGTHDFSAFCSKKPEDKSAVRTIFDIDVQQISPQEVHILVCGNGFLYNMVRIIVFALLEFAQQKLDILQVLHSKERKSIKGLAPAHGLYLKSVEY